MNTYPLTKPLSFEAIRVAFVREVQKVTGLTCIKAEPETPGSPRPCKPYFTLKIVGPSVKHGDDARTKILDSMGNPTTSWNVGGQREIMVDFNCYGNTHEEAYDYMTLWQSALELQTIQEDLRRSSIAVWLNGSVADLSALLNTGYEGRAHMQVAFGIAANMTEDLGEIAVVPFQGTIKTDSGPNQVTGEVDVTE